MNSSLVFKGKSTVVPNIESSKQFLVISLLKTQLEYGKCPILAS